MDGTFLLWLLLAFDSDAWVWTLHNFTESPFVSISCKPRSKSQQAFFADRVDLETHKKPAAVGVESAVAQFINVVFDFFPSSNLLKFHKNP